MGNKAGTESRFTKGWAETEMNPDSNNDLIIFHHRRGELWCIEG